MDGHQAHPLLALEGLDHLCGLVLAQQLLAELPPVSPERRQDGPHERLDVLESSRENVLDQLYQSGGRRVVVVQELLGRVSIYDEQGKREQG